jgi:hypothetical protein
MRTASLAVALLSVAGVAAWQALTVRYSYGGNWTGLFCTGSMPPGPPPQLQWERLFLFPDGGYDGQFYHYIAHDPFLRRGFSASIDIPRYRYRRILVPGLAYLLAGGRDRGVDAAYIAVVWISIGLGAYCLSLFARRHAYPVWLGLLFVLVPAVLISIDRLTIDIALAACAVAFALYTEERAPWKLYLVLLAAGLARETGLLLPAACVLHAAGGRRFRAAGVFLSAAIPAVCWYGYVSLHTPPEPRFALPDFFAGILHRILHPAPYTGYAASVAIWIQAADLLALAGIATVLCWAAWQAFHRPWTPVPIAIYLFAILAIALAGDSIWAEAYGFGRTFTPLLLLAALQGLKTGSMLPALAMLALDPRIVLQMGGQVLNVVRGIMS